MERGRCPRASRSPGPAPVCPTAPSSQFTSAIAGRSVAAAVCHERGVDRWRRRRAGVRKGRFDGKEYSMVWTLNPKEMRGDHVVVATPEPVVRGMDPQMAATALLNSSIQKQVIDGATAALTAGNVRLCAIPKDHLPRPEMYNARLRRVADRSYELQLDGSEAWVPFSAFSTWNEHFAGKTPAGTWCPRTAPMDWSSASAYDRPTAGWPPCGYRGVCPEHPRPRDPAHAALPASPSPVLHAQPVGARRRHENGIRDGASVGSTGLSSASGAVGNGTVRLGPESSRFVSRFPTPCCSNRFAP